MVGGLQTVAIFGATGTIGDSVLDIISRHPESFRPKVLTADRNVKKLAHLALQWQPDILVIADASGVDTLHAALPEFRGQILAGPEGLLQAAQIPVDLAVMSIVGFAALAPMMQLVQSGRRIVLANKECLVAAGGLIMTAAKNNAAEILPADSEHNAIYQLVQGQDNDSIEKIILTASGGPFRTTPVSELSAVTPEMARTHPNWDMGAKISVDCATMMNKGLELIEAQHLFDCPPQIFDVLVHPQSIVHGLVYFTDGSVLVHQGLPDMRTPLAHCMAYPGRLSLDTPKLDLAAIGQLEFEPPDRDKFPCLGLCEAAMRSGGLVPTVLNAANEIAVAAFLEGQIKFTDIASLVDTIMQCQSASVGGGDNLATIIACDTQTRQKTLETVKKYRF